MGRILGVKICERKKERIYTTVVFIVERKTQLKKL